jgi:hypothetical protein
MPPLRMQLVFPHAFFVTLFCFTARSVYPLADILLDQSYSCVLYVSDSHHDGENATRRVLYQNFHHVAGVAFTSWWWSVMIRFRGY